MSTTLNTVVFSYVSGINPINGAACFADVTDQEIKIHYGRSFFDMDEEDQAEIINQYNQ